MFSVKCNSDGRNSRAPRSISPPAASLLAFAVAAAVFALFGIPSTRAQQIRKPGKGGVAELSSSGPQRRQGDITLADGAVDIHYGNQRLRADHVEYNDQTNEAVARGHVIFDYENQHLEADEADYNVSTGRGTFINVRGTVKIERKPNPTVLITDNPLYFEAKNVEKYNNDLYILTSAWITVCDPENPNWQFFAQHARVKVDKNLALVNANFRLLRVPLVWLPYATAPAGPKVRESGFLIPIIGNSSSKGFVLGDAFYWAPTPWLDTTLGAELLSRRGSAERGHFRAKPWENTSINYSYFGVIDRGVPTVINPGLPTQTTELVSQGGHEQQLEVVSKLKNNWRFVADWNELSSLTFRLAFADTFGDAINSEVRSSVFLTHNFNGFSFNVAALNDKSFLTVNPVQTSVSLRNAPEVRMSSVDQSPWQNVPIYFSFDSFVGAAHRSDGVIDTPAAVPRLEFAPTVTAPVHFGPWLDVTATATFRTSYYGDSLVPGSILTTPVLTSLGVTRNDGEFGLDFRLPTIQRYFQRPGSNKKFKHTIEPSFAYHYVTGINNFSQLIRFDTDSTLTNTNELQYGVTQRLFRKDGDDQPQELMSWTLVQKHFFDPTFGGALVTGARNVFQTLDDISPFAFADAPRNWSPLISDFKVTPGGPLDFEQILEYDTQRGSGGQLITIGTLAKIKPYKDFFFTIADFRLDADPLVLQPKTNQIRTLIGYGSETRKGFNITTGISYDITNNALQNQLVQLSYNGNCCGLAVEYRRLALGQVRTDNQFRVAFIIANIGTFGNLRHQEKIF
ncbi:MAG TPA: LPS assembly protein LptD [Candidatus Acidoferrum sp.]|jgi:LPS-assembly protein